MTLSIRALRHFSVLAEEGQYSKAAKRLHLTQSALTRSIQTLEESLGLALVDRATQGVTPTHEGRMVLERAHRILAETSALRREVDMVRGCETGSVSFGVGPHAPVRFLSPLFIQLAQEHPALAVQVDVDDWLGLMRKVMEGRLDFVVALMPGPLPGDLRFRELRPLHCGLFVRRGHPLLAQDSVGLAMAIRGYRLASSRLLQGQHDYLGRLYNTPSAAELPITLECTSIPALRDATLASDLILFSTRESVSHDLKEGRLVELPLWNVAASFGYNVIFHGRRSLSIAAQQVITRITELVSA